MKAGIFMILLGIFIIFLTLGGNRFGLWGFLLWVIAAGFVYLGLDRMIREGFPKGLTSLGAGILIIFHNLGMLRLNFWQFIFAVLGMYAVQTGIKMTLDERNWDHW